ncbi:hypothetical protein GH741_08170 [Aquibacillus halophilus]|uniref:LSM domain-containing protein n=1 Tax=Aquibacillus halophilus TaxID=930132 RepID=A0A6A8DBH8_9BACI|nr:hypothetical protein [Aquibacillus halophilus]MRH42660.1 hypothetical protein [Aquibacillus halophilus]
MSVSHYYELCQKSIKKSVVIRDVHGKVYEGVIEKVDYEKVYLRQHEAGGVPPAGPGGPGMFLWGPAFGAGALVGIGLGSIASLAFRPYPYYW